MTFPKAVATSTRTDLAIKKLETAGIDSRFLHIIGDDQISRDKPFPDIYLKASEYRARDMRP